MEKFNTLLLKVEKGIGLLTINRPQSLNTLNTEVLTELARALDSIARSEAIRVLIITGAGDKSFVAGADINEMLAKNTIEAHTFSTLGNTVFSKIADLRQPVIAAINGFALGGGLELALACDIRIASTNARVGQPEVKIGVIPGFGSTKRLSRIVGLSRAKEYIFTGRTIKADEALRVGLFNRVVEPENLLDEARLMASDIVRNAPLAVENAKRTVNTSYEMPVSDALTLEENAFSFLFSTQDQKEGMQAFIEKRAASFKRQ
ncbi:enoyl-CoA hydratase-related protein [Jeotgalibaca sp. A122]|uniref:enoyl-CoA hydratase-related protein n=1 Tax=Jeotgalibaca sp. A122 TaxID=3457322 RepID=UPI003FD509C5